ncbi:MAG: hypothetical protein Q4A75_06140 [Peptostreptococcaceae bacterium]|nr:hypothetical protein [Peptostreptococcaceae bacterium]
MDPNKQAEDRTKNEKKSQEEKEKRDRGKYDPITWGTIYGMLAGALSMPILTLYDVEFWNVLCIPIGMMIGLIIGSVIASKEN